MSRDARRVVDHLAEYGVDIEEGEVFFQIEVACSMFFPNHILGVIDKVFRGGDKMAKLEKAQDEGWYYFAGPITNMLSSRTTAMQPAGPDENELIDWDPHHAAAAYVLVASSLLAHDMNRREANMLLYECPRLAGKDGFIEAIKICKGRNARTVSYLHGILERKAAEVRAFLRERDEEQEDVWSPDDIVDTISTDEAQNNWAHLGHTIKSLKALNAKTPGRRRRT